MVKVGDVVRYSIQAKSYNAIVLFQHSGQPDHLGTDDEPLVHLAFIAPDRESAVAKSKPGYIPQVFVEYDVVHASHEFSEDYCVKHGLMSPAQIAQARGNGEWDELPADSRIAELEAENRKLLAALAATPEPPVSDDTSDISDLPSANPPE